MPTTTAARDPVRSFELIDNEVTFYRDEGYLCLPGLLSREDAAAVRGDVLDIYKALGMSYESLCRATKPGDKLHQTTQYLEGTLLDRAVNSPRLRELASRLMGGPSSLYMPFTAIKTGGGAGRFHFHQDNQYTRFDGPGINIWIALGEMSPENGCLQMVPRSHLRGTLDSEATPDGDNHRKTKIEPGDFLPLRMMPGDAVAFSRLTVHGSGPNHSSEPRVAYAVQFHRDDVKAMRPSSWEGWRLLKEAAAWRTGPVKAIDPPQPKQNLDGH